MNSNASNFIKKRSDALSITNSRIEHILWYIVECHNIFLNDRITYSQKWVKENTTYKFEDYLKFQFLENYLVLNKKLIKDKISELEEINFSGETQKSYTDVKDSKQKPDKIDIYINKIGLREQWNDEDENVYFAIECKRIRILSDTTDYVKDIEKYTNRNHTNLRLPFEGQIAFIENPKLSYKKVADAINEKLRTSSTVSTISPLKNIALHSSFSNSYLSMHRKNFAAKPVFSIYHLMFDYSQIVRK